MWTTVLATVALLNAGLVAGVLFGVALAGLPAFRDLSAERYVAVHQQLDRHYEPTMPLLVLVGVLADAVLAWRAPGGWPVALLAAGGLLLVAVAVVSQFAAVPLLGTLRRADPAALPPDWADPRPAWRRWHLVRTALAVLALTVTAAAVSCI